MSLKYCATEHFVLNLTTCKIFNSTPLWLLGFWFFDNQMKCNLNFRFSLLRIQAQRILWFEMPACRSWLLLKRNQSLLLYRRWVLDFVKWKRERTRGDKGQEVMFKNQQGPRWFLMTAKTKKNGILDVCMQAKEIGTRRYKLVSRRTHLIV